MAAQPIERPQPRIVVVLPIPLLPVDRGGSARVLGYIRYLRAQGFAIDLVTVYHRRKYRRQVQAEVDRLWFAAPAADAGIIEHAAQYRWLVPRKIRRIAREFLRKRRQSQNRGQPPSALALSRNRMLDQTAQRAAREPGVVSVIANFAWTARSLEDTPEGVLKIIDTHDVQHLRAVIAAQAGHDLSRTWCAAEEEAAELRRADVLLAIQHAELQQLRALVPELPVVLCEHGYTVAAQPLRAETQNLLFVGNDYEPNVEGLRAFMERAWPEIRRQVPGAQLIVAGAVGRHFQRGVPQGVEIAGVVPSLEPYYRTAALVINPVPFGTGLKIKTVEALCLGKCLISSRAGVAGFALDADPPFVVAEARDMAGPVIDLLQDPARRARLEDAALAHARARFSPEAAYAELLKLLKTHSGA